MAEREGDWLLHLATFKKMLPYYFAAGHVNYARYGLYYLRSTSPSRRQTFSKGATCDTTHSGHMEWSVERPVHSIHLYEVRPQCWRINRNHAKVALTIWALSRHISCKIKSDMGEMEEEETGASRVQLYHKEEAKARIQRMRRTGLDSVANLTIA